MIIERFSKLNKTVTPAKFGIQNPLKDLDFLLRTVH